jgi:hypothetical protein
MASLTLRAALLELAKNNKQQIWQLAGFFLYVKSA